MEQNFLSQKNNSEIGTHVRSNCYFSICLRHLIFSRVVTNLIFSPKIPIFDLSCVRTCSELPSYISVAHQSLSHSLMTYLFCFPNIFQNNIYSTFLNLSMLNMLTFDACSVCRSFSHSAMSVSLFKFWLI